MKCQRCGGMIERQPLPSPIWPYCEACDEYFQVDGESWPTISQEGCMAHIILDHLEDWDTPSITVDGDGHQLPMGKIAELEE